MPAEARWLDGDFGAYTRFEGDARFPGLGLNIGVLEPGQAACRYHGEDEQEDFLVLEGECLLMIQGEEHRRRAWDFVHCPAWTEHIFVGAGEGPCALLAVGTRSGRGVICPAWRSRSATAPVKPNRIGTRRRHTRPMQRTPTSPSAKTGFRPSQLPGRDASSRLGPPSATAPAPDLAQLLRRGANRKGFRAGHTVRLRRQQGRCDRGRGSARRGAKASRTPSQKRGRGTASLC